MVILVEGYLALMFFLASSRTSWRRWMIMRWETPDWAKDSEMA